MKTYEKKKVLSADDAIGKIDSSMRVGLPPGCGEPQTLTEALVRNASRFRGLRIVGGLQLTGYDFIREEYAENFHYATWHVMPAIRKAVQSGRVDFLPIRYSEVIPSFLRDGPWAVDAMLIQTSPPDEQGNLSLGPSVSYPMPIARQAPLVIAEVNGRCPRTLGESSIHVSDVDWIVESSRPLVEYGTPKVGDIERRIAAYIADLIPDGATLQIGIGAIPEAILECLPSKKDIGIHSMIVDNMIGLVERGVITNRKKTLNPGKFDVTELMGSEKLWRFSHENPIVNMQPSSFTHDPRIIARIENFIAVNSAVEIDLFGQVNSESIGDTQISGIGGQFDFVEGAYWSPGGRSIFAFPSTSGREQDRSRIVARLGHGARVTTPRYFTETVVTEHGIAELRGKTALERAQALIAVAHPKFREELEKALRG